MSNVVKLHPTNQRSNEQGVNQGQLRRAAALQVARSRPNLDAADQQRAASNLDRLLDQLKQEKGLTRSLVAQKAGLGGNNLTDSTKRLDTYTCPDGASPKRKGRLAKKASRYFDLAKAIADSLGESVEPYLCRIFEGCSFGADAEELPDWDSERWATLSRMISQMAQAVIHDTGLREFWQQVSMMQLTYDAWTEQIGRGHLTYDHFAVETGLLNNWIDFRDSPPIPSLPIARRLMVAPQSGALVLEDGQELAVTFKWHLEIRIALGPTTGGDEIGPMLETRTFFEVLDNDQQPLNFSHPYLSRFSTIPDLIDEDQPRPILEMLGLEEPEPERRMGTENHYLGFEEVSPAILRELLMHDEYPVESLRFNLHTSMNQTNRPQTRFEWGSPAADLYRELLDQSFEKDLSTVCLKLRDQLEACRQEIRERCLVAEAEALNRWQRPNEKRTGRKGIRK